MSFVFYLHRRFEKTIDDRNTLMEYVVTTTENDAATAQNDVVLENTFEDAQKKNTYEEKYASIGVRVTDVGYVMWQTMNLLKQEDNGHNTNCMTRNWHVRNTVQRGMKTIIYLECSECDKLHSIVSHPNNVDPNYQLAAGGLVSGVPYANIEEIYAAQGMPCMSSKTFRSYQEKVTLDALEIARECMKEAAKREAEIAVKKGHVKDGVSKAWF